MSILAIKARLTAVPELLFSDKRTQSYDYDSIKIVIVDREKETISADLTKHLIQSLSTLEATFLVRGVNLQY